MIQINKYGEKSVQIIKDGNTRTYNAVFRVRCDQNNIILSSGESNFYATDLQVPFSDLQINGVAPTSALDAYDKLLAFVGLGFKLGGGSSGTTPTLQQVTDIGAVTTNTITIADGTTPAHAVTKRQLDLKANQTDLNTETLARQTADTALQNQITALPTPVNADWNAASGLAEILNKPVLLTQQNIDNSINDIKIGGVNLLLNSNKPLPVGSAGGVVASVENDMLKVVASAGNENYQEFVTGSLNIADLKDGDLITLSYWAYSPNSTQIPSLYVNSSMGYHNMNGIMSDKISVFTATVSYKSDFEIRLHLGFGGKIGTFYFKYFKIEKGNKATDWSPSYNDIKIGATNLLPNTNQGVTGWSKNTANGIINFSEVSELGVKAVKATTTTVSTAHHVLLYNLNRALLRNSTQYTLSVDLLCEFDATADFRLAGSDATNLLVNFGTKAIVANTWTHVELTATSNTNTGTNQLLYIRGFNTLGSVTFANLKIEIGNKATDWSAAPNDFALKNELIAYEKGVWTPAPHFAGIVFTVTKAEYIKTGGVMHVYCVLNITADGTGASAFGVQGLPVLPTGLAAVGHCVIHSNTGFSDIYCSVPEGSASIHVRQRNTGVAIGYNTILNNQMKAGMNVFLNVYYFI